MVAGPYNTTTVSDVSRGFMQFSTVQDYRDKTYYLIIVEIRDLWLIYITPELHKKVITMTCQ